MASLATQPSRTKQKITRRRQPQIAREKRPIEADAYYTIPELTLPSSPYWTCSASTIFRALKDGNLKANYVGRKVLLKGSSVHAWLAGKGGGEQCNK